MKVATGQISRGRVVERHRSDLELPSSTDRRGILANATRLVAGPIVVTYSRHDTAARVVYKSVAGVVGGDDDAPGELAAERGALGYDGAKAAGSVEATLAPAGKAYALPAGAHL